MDLFSALSQLEKGLHVFQAGSGDVLRLQDVFDIDGGVLKMSDEIFSVHILIVTDSF
jgi:hypothetical protein